MKLDKARVAVILVAFALVALVWVAGEWGGVRVEGEDGLGEEGSLPVIGTEKMSGGFPAALDANVPIVSPDPVEQASYVKLFKEVMGWGRTPIAFYGKVVDEGGNPVNQAEAKIIVSDTSAEGTTDYYLRSDQDGHFTLSDIRGKGLSVYVSKAGYYSPRTSVGHFEYAGVGADYKPDPNNPEIFRLRKMGERVPLVSKRGRLELIPDRPIVWLDLFTHRTSTNPWTESVGIGVTHVVEANQTRLRFTFKVSGGGIQQADGEFDFIAPTSGYESEISLIAEDRTPRRFFLRFESGLYGLVNVRFVPGNPNILIDTLLNPDASRNLESDPERSIFVRTHANGSISLIYPKGHEPTSPSP